MNESSYSSMLRSLSNDYYLNDIDFEAYRSQRKILLDKIDAEFIGSRQGVEKAENDDESSNLKQTVSFWKNSDIDREN